MAQQKVATLLTITYLEDGTCKVAAPSLHLWVANTIAILNAANPIINESIQNKSH